MPELKLCGKAECTVDSTGTCVEGHTPLASCPFYGKSAPQEADVETSESTAGQKGGEAVAKGLPLPSGEALTLAEVDRFLLKRPIILVAVVGDRDSGKTTLLSSIYGQFLRGPFAGHSFTECKTLVGLERRSHYSRVASGLHEPDTERTKLPEGLRFIHLGLTPESSDDSRIDLIMSDRAGETYLRARSDPTRLDELIEIAKADRVALLLDGGRIADPVHRASAFQSVRKAIRAFTDGTLIGQQSVVQVVLTKTDLFDGHAEAALIESRIEEFQQRLTADFEARLGELTYWRIAARDPTNRLSPPHGLDALIREWTTIRETLVSPAVLPTATVSQQDKLLITTSLQELP